MAMLRLASGARVLASVDQLVAGRHVNLDTTPLKLVGRKAMARSLSDIAAMATRPLASLVAAALPPDFGEERARELFDAMRATASDFECPLIGGDIAFHKGGGHPLVCSVTVFSEPIRIEPGGEMLEPMTRCGAKPGDRVYVTGQLGGSLNEDGTGRHLTFTPRIAEAIELASLLRSNLHAMIDISDGLGRDAMHIAEQSGVAIELEAARLPCRIGIDWRRAVSDGEDYELCFAAIGEVPNAVKGVSVTCVGQVIELQQREGPRCTVRDGESVVDVSTFGWQHESC